MRHIGQLVRADIELLRQDGTVADGLVQHVNEVRVLKDVLDLLRCQEVLDVLRDAGRNAAPLTEALPDLHGIGRRLLLAEQQMHLIHVVARGSVRLPVNGDAVPDRILHDQHADLLQLLSEILDVVAHQAIADIHIGAMIEDIEGTGHIDFKCCCDRSGLRLLLLKQCIVKILQHRHIFLPRMLEVMLIDLVDAAVDDRLLHRLQSLLAAHDQLAQRQDEIRLQGNRVIVVGVIHVNVHGINELIRGRADLDHLPAEALHQRRILRLRI